MFICGLASGQFIIYNFYTCDSEPYFSNKPHNMRIRGIDWAEDDMGFTTAGADGNVFFFDIQMLRFKGSRLQEKDYNSKSLGTNSGFTDVANIPGTSEAIVVGGSSKVCKTSDSKNSCDAKAQIS
jgi:WD40 repeat protein